MVVQSADFCSWKSEDWATLCLLWHPFKKEASGSHLLTPSAKLMGQVGPGQNQMKVWVLFICTGAPLMSHAETSHCWFPLLTSKQTRKEMENSSPISYHRHLWCCIMLDRACTSPPSCLSAASPHRGGSCVCRDATSWQGRAVTQPLKSWRAHSPDLC